MTRLVIRSAGEAGTDALLDRDLTKTAAGALESGGGDPDFEDLANPGSRTEELSRKEFPAVLRKLGVDGKPNVTKADGQVPEAIENRLSGLGFTEVFAAVKDLQAQIRSGESPRRARPGAGLLAPGSAQRVPVAPSTQSVQGTFALVFPAAPCRGEPKDPWGLWHRAFAEALVGLHANALTDLAAADSVSNPAGKAVRPSWVEPISALVRCDAESTRGQGRPAFQADVPSASDLLEFPATPNVTLPAASDVLKLEPDCYRAIDAMCQISAVSTLHVVTLLGPETLEETLPKKLKAIEALPLPVQDSLKKAEGGSFDLARLLEQAAGSEQDAGEFVGAPGPSDPRDAVREGIGGCNVFMKLIWSVPVDEFWAEARGWFRPSPGAVPRGRSSPCRRLRVQRSLPDRPIQYDQPGSYLSRALQNHQPCGGRIDRVLPSRDPQPLRPRQ